MYYLQSDHRSTVFQRYTCLALGYEFVYPPRVAKAHKKIPVGINPAPVPRATTIKAGQYCACPIQHTDAGRRAICPPFADVEDPLSVYRDIHGLLDVSPHGDGLPIRGEDLDAVVLPVTHIDAPLMH